MKYLVSNKFKKPGWILFIIGIAAGIMYVINDYESQLFKTKVISLFNNTLLQSQNNSLVTLYRK